MIFINLSNLALIIHFPAGESMKLTEIPKLRDSLRQVQDNVSSLKGKIVDFNRFR